MSILRVVILNLDPIRGRSLLVESLEQVMESEDQGATGAPVFFIVGA
jgi:hypothetical protein